MASTQSRPSPDTVRPDPRLYVLLDPGSGETAEMAARLRAIGRAADVAAVLLRATRDEAALAPLVAAAHAVGAACLIEGDVALAERIGADGAHLGSVEALRTALPALRPHGIAGAGGLRSRHDAMSAGELGADYVMFGEPDADGRRPPVDQVLERVDWWAQLFEPPCVAFAGSADEAAALAEAGADFLALDATTLDEAGIRAFAARLSDSR